MELAVQTVGIESEAQHLFSYNTKLAIFIYGGGGIFPMIQALSLSPSQILGLFQKESQKILL